MKKTAYLSMGATTLSLEHQKFFSRTMTELKRRAEARSAIDRFYAWVLAENLGMIMADYTGDRADNSILEQGRACYTVRRDGTSWRFSAVGQSDRPI